MDNKVFIVEDYLMTIFSFIILLLSILFTRLINYTWLSLISHIMIYISGYLTLYGLYNINKYNRTKKA